MSHICGAFTIINYLRLWYIILHPLLVLCTHFRLYHVDGYFMIVPILCFLLVMVNHQIINSLTLSWSASSSPLFPLVINTHLFTSDHVRWIDKTGLVPLWYYRYYLLGKRGISKEKCKHIPFKNSACTCRIMQKVSLGLKHIIKANLGEILLCMKYCYAPICFVQYIAIDLYKPFCRINSYLKH